MRISGVGGGKSLTGQKKGYSNKGIGVGGTEMGPSFWGGRKGGMGKSQKQERQSAQREKGRNGSVSHGKNSRSRESRGAFRTKWGRARLFPTGWGGKEKGWETFMGGLVKKKKRRAMTYTYYHKGKKYSRPRGRAGNEVGGGKETQNAPV